ncbi:tripartite motif-containing protein 46 isoform X1 [Cervus elaphus]|uniref:tripartite motif-containing protein 46 isoform X1 n=1 Tax=Cervus elaphus TaxID=9860 RepID=UPI001CC295A7|nr:tripartite motif-containing protein 46 isoform X1 [Cervus elaphus]
MAEGEDMQTFTSIMDALVRISTSMKNMEKELLCPVCQEMYKQPLVLPCTHSVCQACAREVLGQQGYIGHGGDPSSEPTSPASTPSTRSPRLSRRTLPKPDRLDRLLKSGFGTYPGRKRGALHPQVIMFPCPACQGDVELGERGLAGLFRNLTLERVVERYRQSVSVGGAILCQLCKPPPLEATKGCTECRATFCNECFKLFHPWGTQKAQHEPTLPTLSFRPKGLMCPDHKEEVTHYCKTCQRLVCQLCRVRRTHSGHKITPVLSAYQALKDKLTKSLTYILGNQDTVQTQICELEETVRHTEVSGQQAKEEVSQLVRGLGAVLEEKRASLLQAIEECQQERLARLSAQIQEHRSLLDGSGLVGYAQEVLKETDQPCFVQAAKQLHNRISRATEALQTFRPAASSSFRHCQLDVGREMKLLTELNFLRVPEAPVIDTQRTFAYDQIFLCWRLPPHSPPAWHYTIEFRRTDVPAQPGPTRWQRREEVRGTSALLENPDTGSVYVLRVRGCNKAGYGEYSEDVHLHTPPAPVLHFFLDGRWGTSRERLAISKDQRAVRSVPGLPLLLAAERLLTGCHLSVDVVLGDVAVTQGRSYWACAVDPASYLVKVRPGQWTRQRCRGRHRGGVAALRFPDHRHGQDPAGGWGQLERGADREGRPGGQLHGAPAAPPGHLPGLREGSCFLPGCRVLPRAPGVPPGLLGPCVPCLLLHRGWRSTATGARGHQAREEGHHWGLRQAGLTLPGLCGASGSWVLSLVASPSSSSSHVVLSRPLSVFPRPFLTKGLSSAHLSGCPPFSLLPVNPGSCPHHVSAPCAALGILPESWRQPLPHPCPVLPPQAGWEGRHPEHWACSPALPSALPSSLPHPC